MEVASSHCGSFLIVSFPEAIPGDDTLYFIQDNHIGGLILFSDHCRFRENLRSWLYDFKKTLKRPFIVAVDQEGGRVRRFTGGFPMLEAPRYYGHRDDLRRYQSDLARVCEQLRETGINLNLVPSVDLLDTRPGHVMDTRTFSDDPKTVAKFARATIEIHREQGLCTCAKHFPGLGRSEGDPHQVLAAAKLSEDDFREVELPPFRDAIESGVDAVMVTHLSVPDIDKRPAIISEKMIGGWLKNDLGFAGPVITDDLLMEGAADIDPVEILTIKSFAAGSDLLLFGRNLKKTREAFRSLSESWLEEKISRQRVADASKRVDMMLKKIVSWS